MDLFLDIGRRMLVCIHNFNMADGILWFGYRLDVRQAGKRPIEGIHTLHMIQLNRKTSIIEKIYYSERRNGGNMPYTTDGHPPPITI